MSWYEDLNLWSGFSEVLFTPERERLAADVVATSPLFAFAPESRVLDQCCGVGVYTVPLARHGHQVTGDQLARAAAAIRPFVQGFQLNLTRASIRPALTLLRRLHLFG